MHQGRKWGFTLLELVIVIIIMGVLASLALPRFFKVIEQSRSVEALAAMSALRQGMERCYLMNNGSYANCTTMADLSMDDPGASPNAHFDYMISTTAVNYGIFAFRNNVDGGSLTAALEQWSLETPAYAMLPVTYNVIVMEQCGNSTIECGKGGFESLGICPALCIAIPSPS